MKILELLKGKKDKKTAKNSGYFTDAYQDSLNRLGKEQLSAIVNRGVVMPGGI